MNVSEAVRTRRSARAFLSDPVSLDVLRSVLETAARAPSGGNLQPWRVHVLVDEAMLRFRTVMRERLASGGMDEIEYLIYPPNLHEPYRSRRFAIGEALYAQLGIERSDKAGRLLQFARNFDFFGAPVGLFCFVDRKMGAPQWSDLGMYLQTVMLLLREQGLDSCAQEAWSAYAQTVSQFLGVASEQMLFCGMSIGYADEAAAANAVVSERAALDEFAVFHER